MAQSSLVQVLQILLFVACSASCSWSLLLLLLLFPLFLQIGLRVPTRLRPPSVGDCLRSASLIPRARCRRSVRDIVGRLDLGRYPPEARPLRLRPFLAVPLNRFGPPHAPSRMDICIWCTGVNVSFEMVLRCRSRLPSLNLPPTPASSSSSSSSSSAVSEGPFCGKFRWALALLRLSWGPLRAPLRPS